MSKQENTQGKDVNENPAKKAQSRAKESLEMVKNEDPVKTVPLVAKQTQAVAHKKVDDETSKAKSAALDKALGEIQKQFGKGSVMKLSDKPVVQIPVSSTGSLAIDLALGTGGLPKGRIVEMYGPESSGKTTIALQTLAQIQKKGGTVALIDAEHAFDPVYAKNLGVDTENLIISQPDNGEQALEITEKLVRSGAVDAIVVDSVAALVPRAEIEGEMGDSHMGLQARLMSQALRKLTGIANQTGTMLIFINQIRMKIGVMFGNPETTTGGNALKFYASVRLEIRRAGQIKKGEDIIGNEVTVKVVKNKMAAPFKKVTVDMMFGKGVDAEADILELGVQAGLIEKSGAWFSMNDEKMGQGKEQAKEHLRQRPETCATLREQILKLAAEGKLVLEGKAKKDSE